MGHDSEKRAQRLPEGGPHVYDGSLSEWPAFDVKHVVEVSEDEPDRCTVYPADVSEKERMTTWITAERGSYLSVVSVQ